MSDTYSDVDLKDRIVELETRLQKLDAKIMLIGKIMGTPQFQSLFDDPLKRFFEAPEFWEIIYEDNVPCHNECSRMYHAAIEACDEYDQECIKRAGDAVLECRENCGDPFPTPF